MGAIDRSDDRFRISEDLESRILERSIREIGLRHPVSLLMREDARYCIVAGFRRLTALGRLGGRLVPARVMKASALSTLEAFRIAFWENLSHRSLDPLETARSLHVLKETCGVPQETLVEEYLPALSLPAHKNVLGAYLRIHGLQPGLRRKFREGEVTLASVERLSEMPGDVQDRMAALLDRVRWSASRQREVLQLLQELAVLHKSTIIDVVAMPEIASVLEDSRLTHFQRGEQIHRILYRRRNPRLSEAEARFAEARRESGLPQSVRISPDPYFESPRIKFEFEASSSQVLREVSAALGRAAESPGADALFRVV